MKTIIWIVLGVIVVGGIGWWYKAHNTAAAPAGVACTMEAKLCPDGSYVGRSGPNCEFAQCPGTVSDLKTYTDPASGVSFAYPEKLPAKYITAVDWPPKLQVLNKAFSCTEAGSPTAQAGQTVAKTISGRQYCITTEQEGAAGSTYTNYAYATPDSGKTYIFTFSTKSPQCANYDDPQKTECAAERSSFNIDGIIDSIAKSAFLRAS